MPVTKNLFDLTGQAIVVFGCGTLGAPVIKALLDLGAQVVAADLCEEDIRKRLGEQAGRETCLPRVCDLRRREQIAGAFDACAEAFGKVSASVNLAHYGSRALLDGITEEDFLDGLEGGLVHVLRTTTMAVPYLEKNGGGIIVNTASMYGMVAPDPRNYLRGGNHNPPAYGASKAAVLMFSKYCAAHLAPKNIRVNCVTPGPFPIVSDQPSEFIEDLAGCTMLGRVGRPDEIAGAFCYLLSQAATFVTGANIVVDGGWTAW